MGGVSQFYCSLELAVVERVAMPREENGCCITILKAVPFLCPAYSTCLYPCLKMPLSLFFHSHWIIFWVSQFYLLFSAIKINKFQNPPQSHQEEPSIAHSILFPDDSGDEEEEEDDHRKPEECRTVLSHRRSLWATQFWSRHSRLPYSTYLYLDFHLCFMTKLKEHSREIC